MTTDITPAEGMAQSIVPLYIDGDNKATVLGYLVAGFSKTEAIKLAGLHQKTWQRWTDPETGDAAFIDFINRLPDIRKELSDQLLDIEFTRNFRLFMQKDFKVLFKEASGGELTATENSYLNLIRKFYTPQHLAMIRQLMSGDVKAKEDAFDFTKTVLEIRLSKEEHHGR